MAPRPPHAARLKRYALAAASQGRAGCAVRFPGGHASATDLPRPAGDDAAPQPVELLLAALVGCKTATAHFVARHSWPRPFNRIDAIEWADVAAHRDEAIPVSLPICPGSVLPGNPGLLEVRGVAFVRPPRGALDAGSIGNEDVRLLGEEVERRCPVAAMVRQSGCRLIFDWRLVRE
ncbi:unnamed protein product [Prorocentrum cordatum]|uniref:OsmC family peroxiredoxin n=1 Tax=Prorocentrum cordatum TaxID=2364126 RepID=A0ABN9XRE8_9DINO|nr:unnamed protein product [Polarella glacialis]